jgi:membrane protease YdiL (CAAX protease family)
LNDFAQVKEGKMTESLPAPERRFEKCFFTRRATAWQAGGWLQTSYLSCSPSARDSYWPAVCDSDLELPDGVFLALNQVVSLFATTLSIYLARRFLDKRSFSSLGLKLDRWTAIDILAGIVITFFIMGFIYLVELGLGWLTFDGFAWETDPILTVLGGTLGMFVVFIFVGWNEELLSRGYHLQTIASGMNLFWGVVISSTIFGLLHLGNPNATWVSAAGIFFAGLFLATAISPKH